jgi:hypothetical protein
MRAGDFLPAVFGEGQEHVEAFVAVVTDKIISRHGCILTESGSGGESCGRLQAN